MRAVDALRGRCLIDLHSHILPAIDDGAPDVATALEMAGGFVADGVTPVAGPPHNIPRVFANRGPDIQARVVALQAEFYARSIPLTLLAGADIHVVPGLVRGLASGELLTLGDSRYVLIEPPHHVAPPRLESVFFDLLVAGYVPILTHPERLTWLGSQYRLVGQLVASGVWMQLTAGSLTGAFGRGAQQLAERMLDEGLVHLIATDAHDAKRRPPNLRRGVECAAKQVGGAAGLAMGFTRHWRCCRIPRPALCLWLVLGYETKIS